MESLSRAALSNVIPGAIHFLLQRLGLPPLAIHCSIIELFLFPGVADRGCNELEARLSR